MIEGRRRVAASWQSVASNASAIDVTESPIHGFRFVDT
jgi:hypothetical protein